MQSLYPNKDFKGMGKRFFGGRINNGLQTISALRKGADVIVQRYFTQLSAAGGQHYTIPTMTPEVIEMTVMSPTGSTVGLPTGATAPTANKLQTISFAYSGDPIIYIGRNGSNYFSGYIVDVKFFVGGNLVRHYPLDDSGVTNVARELVSGADGTRVNLTQASTELFTKVGGYWLAGSLSGALEIGADSKDIGNKGGTDTGAYNKVTGEFSIRRTSAANQAFVDYREPFIQLGESYLVDVETLTANSTIHVRLRSAANIFRAIPIGRHLVFFTPDTQSNMFIMMGTDNSEATGIVHSLRRLPTGTTKVLEIAA
jgi:hypothetical protein